MNLNPVQECPNIDALILDTLLDDNTYIAVFDSSFKFVRASEAYEKTFEIPRSEIEGKHASEILGIEVFEQTMLPKLLRCLSGEVVQYESWLDYNIAGKRYVRVTYKPFKIEAEGKITHILSRARA